MLQLSGFLLFPLTRNEYDMSEQHLKPVVRIAISLEGENHGSMYGRGVAELCQGVLTYGSLNAAAKNMHMAYSKAWRIMKNTEQRLNVVLIDRDGAHGSTLTEEGQQLLKTWNDINRKVSAYAKKTFEKMYYGSH